MWLILPVYERAVVVFAEAIKISICEMKHGGSFRGCFAGVTRPPEKLLCETERGSTLTPNPPRVVLRYRYMAGVFPLLLFSQASLY